MVAKLRLESIKEAAQSLIEADHYVTEVYKAMWARGFNINDDNAGNSVGRALAMTVCALNVSSDIY